MHLPRLHLFEFTDQPWLPGILRTLFTEQLSWGMRTARPHDAAVPDLIVAMRMTGRRRIVDLCSGAGIPPLVLQPALEAALREPVDIVLTDKYPAVRASITPAEGTKGAVSYLPEPVDAVAPPPGLDGVRTLFEGFHHFRPDEARRILQGAVDAGEAIALLEVTRRSGANILIGLFLSLAAPFVMPFVRPFRWSRLFFSYVVPAALVMTLWDTLVSNLRSYTLGEIRDMVSQLSGCSYEWRYGERRRGLIYTAWVVGYPKK